MQTLSVCFSFGCVMSGRICLTCEFASQSNLRPLHCTFYFADLPQMGRTKNQKKDRPNLFPAPDGEQQGDQFKNKEGDTSTNEMQAGNAPDPHDDGQPPKKKAKKKANKRRTGPKTPRVNGNPKGNKSVSAENEEGDTGEENRPGKGKAKGNKERVLQQDQEGDTHFSFGGEMFDQSGFLVEDNKQLHAWSVANVQKIGYDYRRNIEAPVRCLEVNHRTQNVPMTYLAVDPKHIDGILCDRCGQVLQFSTYYKHPKSCPYVKVMNKVNDYAPKVTTCPTIDTIRPRRGNGDDSSSSVSDSEDRRNTESDFDNEQPSPAAPRTRNKSGEKNKSPQAPAPRVLRSAKQG